MRENQFQLDFVDSVIPQGMLKKERKRKVVALAIYFEVCCLSAELLNEADLLIK